MWLSKLLINKVCLNLLMFYVLDLVLYSMTNNLCISILGSAILTILSLTLLNSYVHILRRKVKSLKIRVLTLNTIGFKLPVALSKLGYQDIYVNLMLITPSLITISSLILNIFRLNIVNLFLMTVMPIALSLIPYVTVKVRLGIGIVGNMLMVSLTLALIIKALNDVLGVYLKPYVIFVMTYLATLLGFDLFNLDSLRSHEGGIYIGGFGVYDALMIIPLITTSISASLIMLVP